MKIRFINQQGGGMAEYVEVPEGTTIDQLFQEKMKSGANPADYHLRVNRDPVVTGYRLQEGDKVAVTALKIEGQAS